MAVLDKISSANFKLAYFDISSGLLEISFFFEYSTTRLYICSCKSVFEKKLSKLVSGLVLQKPIVFRSVSFDTLLK